MITLPQIPHTTYPSKLGPPRPNYIIILHLKINEYSILYFSFPIHTSLKRWALGFLLDLLMNTPPAEEPQEILSDVQSHPLLTP